MSLLRSHTRVIFDCFMFSNVAVTEEPFLSEVVQHVIHTVEFFFTHGVTGRKKMALDTDESNSKRAFIIYFIF